MKLNCQTGPAANTRRYMARSGMRGSGEVPTLDPWD